jgi:hypothetical protein
MWVQTGDITRFIEEMPANAKIAIAYMVGGRAALAGPLSSDPARVLQELHINNGNPGSNGSPYFCLSDLAKIWPHRDGVVRRVVVMITDGVDEFDRRYDPEDPYVRAAINDSVRAGLQVYSMYWHDQSRAGNSAIASAGLPESGRGLNQDQAGKAVRATASGQNLLQQVTQATGGNSYWQGDSNPAAFAPYFDDLRKRLRNQFALSFSASFKGKPEVVGMKVKVSAPADKVSAPQFVYLDRAPATAQ